MSNLGSLPTFQATRFQFIRSAVATQGRITRSFTLFTGVFAPAVVTRKFPEIAVRAILTPPWWGSRPVPHTRPLPDREIRGQVQQNGVALPHAIVHLYYRRTGVLIATSRSNLAGDVVFTDLMLDALGYYAIALDPEGTPLQNAIIWDWLSPTPI